MKELSEQLDAQQFVQVHRSTMVNMNAVAKADRDWSGKVTLTMKGRKETIAVSRQHAQLFGDAELMVTPTLSIKARSTP